MGSRARLLCVFLGGWATAALSAPSGRTSTAAADPLLRRPWVEADLASTRGEIHRLARLLERSGSQFPIRDAAGRIFRVDLKGRVSFSPFDGNWQMAVPRRSESALALAEAEGLYARGVRNHAVFLLKAVAAMGRLPGAGGGLRADAARASRRLSALARRESFVEEDAATEPFVLYDDTRDETIVYSNTFRLRLVLPGPWRYQYGEARRHQTQWPERVVYLGQQGFVLVLGLDNFSHAGTMQRLGGLIDLWDIRRSLGAQRKRNLDFVRKSEPESASFCQGNALRRFSPAGAGNTPRLDDARTRRRERAEVPACGLYRSSLTRVTQAPSREAEAMELFRTGRSPAGPQRVTSRFLNFYHLRPGRGLFLELELPEGRAQNARETFGRILSGLYLY